MTIDRALRAFRNSIIVLAALTASCRQDPEMLKRKYVASGDSYMAQKKYDAAIIEYRNASEQDNRFGEARSKLALAYIQTGDGTRAVGEAVRAADLLR
jgi:tetratricopeptide (TPR) repeat protein